MVSQTFAQESKPVDLTALKHPLKPLLWKIEGKGLAQPSYLFGTIHLTDERVTTLHPLAQKAFEDAAEVYTESDQAGREPTPEKRAARKALFQWGDANPLAERAGKELVERLDVELKFLKTEYDAEALRKNKLWSLAHEIPMLPLTLKDKRPHLDKLLWQRAHEAGKKTFGLEDSIERVRGLDALPLDQQRKMLEISVEMVRDAREKGVHVFQRMLDAYLLGDVATISNFVTEDRFIGREIDPAIGKKLAKIMLHDRNEKMAVVIGKALDRPKSVCCFFAMGSAHCVGEKRVADYLEKAGYKVTRVIP